jgi:hypothetical protein
MQLSSGLYVALVSRTLLPSSCAVDCSIVASRLQINLDDLLWVLTNSQLKAALTFVGSLRDIVARSSEQSKRLAAEKLRVSECDKNDLFNLPCLK